VTLAGNSRVESSSPALVSSAAPALPAAAAFDPGPILDAHESNLAEYLNQPVHDILSRLGVPGVPQAAPPSGQPDSQAHPPDQSNSGLSGLSSLSSLASLPMMLIQPVTDALGTLGSGQFGDLDPTAMLGGVTQALESSAQPVQQAMSGLDGAWQGQAATAATAKTTAALDNGTQIAGQANDLSASLATAAASVQQAHAQLVAIVGQFTSTLAAIGPNLAFPWGWAAAIAAANQAITQSTQVMSQLTGSLSTEAAHVDAVGAPVPVTPAPQVGANLAATAAPALSPTAAFSSPLSAALGAPAAAAGAPIGATSGLGSSLAPMMGLVSGLASPAMEGVSAATGAIGSGASAGAPAQLTGSTDQKGQSHDGSPEHTAGHGGGGKGATGGIPVLPAQSRLTSLPVPESAIAPEVMTTDVVAPAGMSGAPTMGGTPMARGANAGVGRSHNAAAFLHTTDQGDEIIGDLGGIAPPVLGVREAVVNPDTDLTI
jgi:hypothetical protein